MSVGSAWTIHLAKMTGDFEGPALKMNLILARQGGVTLLHLLSRSQGIWALQSRFKSAILPFVPTASCLGTRIEKLLRAGDSGIHPAVAHWRQR